MATLMRLTPYEVNLKDANPLLDYNVLLDVLMGINDKQAVKQHLTMSRSLLPHGHTHAGVR